MLMHSGRIFLRVAAMMQQPGVIPTIFVDILRDNTELLGQARFNYDSTYSNGIENEVRISFDLPVKLLEEIVPSNGGDKLLKDIVVSLVNFVMVDNNKLFPKDANAFMVVHSYDEDINEMGEINSFIINVLRSLGAEGRDMHKWIITPKKLEYKYIQGIINRV